MSRTKNLTRLQLWYLERTTKRTLSEGTSESSTKQPKVNMIKTVDSREKEKYLYELGETIQEIEDQGKALNQRKDQQIWLIDGDQGKLMKLHKELDEVKPYLKGKPSEERCVILEDEVRLLWRKISVYEHYGNSERILRNQAVDELNKVKTKIQDGGGESVEKPNKVWKTVWKEPKSTQHKGKHQRS